MSLPIAIILGSLKVWTCETSYRGDSRVHVHNLNILLQSNFPLWMLSLSLLEWGSEFDMQELILPVYDAVSQHADLTPEDNGARVSMLRLASLPPASEWPVHRPCDQHNNKQQMNLHSKWLYGKAGKFGIKPNIITNPRLCVKWRTEIYILPRSRKTRVRSSEMTRTHN